MNQKLVKLIKRKIMAIIAKLRKENIADWIIRQTAEHDGNVLEKDHYQRGLLDMYEHLYNELESILERNKK